MYKHILIPTDGSKLAARAAQAGVQLARTLGARVTGFFAAPPATPIVFKGILPVGYVAPEEHERSIRDATEAYLGIIEKAAKAAGVRCETLGVTDDFPADAIVAAAKKRGCDLIFMGSHGRTGLRRNSLLGSQTLKVLSGAPMAVLVYREQK